MIVARRERQVEWGDCDPARIVFNPRFFEWFDAQTALIFETAGLAKRDLLRRLDFAGIPLVETGARFHQPVRFGDIVAIEFENCRRAEIELRRRASADERQRTCDARFRNSRLDDAGPERLGAD